MLFRSLQLSHGIDAVAMRHSLVEISCGKVACLTCQLIDRHNGTIDNLPTHHEQEQKANDNDAQHDVEKAIVATENLTLGADDGKAPSCAGHGTEEDVALLAIDGDMPHALLASHHVTSQPDAVGILHGVGTGEDAVRDQLCGVWIDEVVASLAQHDAIGTGRGFLGGDCLGKPVQREVGGDHSDGTA